MKLPTLTFEESLLRVRDLLNNTDDRVVIGIVGKPGAGKSTLSDYLIKYLPKQEVSLIPMDGYHLSNLQLELLGRSDRKGAPDTFDSYGFAALIEKIRIATTDTYFPIFHREIEESIAAEGVVYANSKVVLVEGNYLLLDEGGWAEVRKNITESWYVETQDELRLERLIERHIFFGKEKTAAIDWANGTDEKNAKLIEKTKIYADYLICNT